MSRRLMTKAVSKLAAQRNKMVFEKLKWLNILEHVNVQ